MDFIERFFSYSKEESTESFKEAMFQVYLRDFSSPVIQWVGLLTVLLLFSSFGLTRYLGAWFDARIEEHRSIFLKWRLSLSVILLWMVGALYFSNWIKRRLNLFFGITYVSACFITSFYIMPIREPNSSLRFMTYIIPFFTIIAPANFPVRLTLTFGSLSLIVGAWFSLGYQPYFYVPLVTIFSGISLISVIIGHFCFYRLLRKSFFQNRKLKIRARELDQAKMKAQQANRNKSLFLANVSHDLRTPLNSILGYADMLRNTFEDSENNRKIETVHSAANDLSNLIDTLMDVSKIELNEYDIEEIPLNLGELLENIEKLFQSKSSAKNVEFVSRIDQELNRSVYLDERALKQVLYNLLDNAIKYTDQGEVTLSFEAVDWSNANDTVDLLIEVDDTGQGISEERLETIFEIFNEGDQREVERAEGFGLGLYICNELVEAMGGSLDVESEEGVGTTFSIILPGLELVGDENRKNQQSQDVAGKKVNFRNSNVLVVDDKKENRAILMEYLQELNINGMECTSGEEALKLALNEQPDLILLDIKMPGMDGYQTLDSLKNHEETQSIPILAVTAHATSNELTRIDRYDFDGVLIKPVQRDDLKKHLMSFLEYEIGGTEVGEDSNTSEVTLDASEFEEELSGKMLEELLELFRESKSTGNLDKIKEFSDKLQEVTPEEDDDPLNHYANDLRRAVDELKFVRVNNLLETFESITSSL